MPAPKNGRWMPVLFFVVAFFVVLGVIGAVAGGGKAAKSGGTKPQTASTATAAAAPAAVPAVEDTTAPALTQEPAATTEAPPPEDKLTYAVTGSSADIMYGPAGTSLSGQVPLKVTKTLGKAAYYAISAQLNGGGHVKCMLEINGKVVSSAEASGGYNIAMCEIVQNPVSGGWVDANTG
ncbi:hypothetical protein QMK19_16040 [Streptomyces sp. H10-C2]|uniref:hypothetical protein n=1 Tax=unclassified Streptomyces TaxID=2593676 RepID=UPI0024B9C7F7|nr:MULTISPECIES: hypothetical protein [unclassified Streptomyces]MDJ0346205.1 hypothetical protein [Streptomyces sp. PH10-H1]MDJ0371156.1 hypothetical protein [Streptomyces sp. H10-C2]